MRRRLLIGCCAVVLAGSAAIGALLLTGQANTGHPSASSTGRVLGPTSPSRSIAASLILRLPGQQALDRFLAASQDPRSPIYGASLHPSDIGARFGLSMERISSMRAALSAHGLRVVQSYPQRTALRIIGNTAAFERAFATQLQDRIDARGARYFAPQGIPRVPDWLGRDVVGVTGLNSAQVMFPADVPADGLQPTTLGTAYDFGPLRQQGLDGSGQTVAVVSFDSFADADLSAYQKRFGVQGPAVQRVSINGGTVPGKAEEEVNLDLDTIRGIAPGAQVINYEAPAAGTSNADVINQIVADHKAHIISTSWGSCDLLLTPAQRAADETALAAARAAGITIFVASGDNGAYDCQSVNPGDLRPSVDWPSANDNVVSVGGTRLAVRQDGSYLAEYGWEGALKGDGSGGGLASVTARPSWQQAPGVQNSDSNGHRQVPDVAGPADPSSGMLVVSGGQSLQIGGTSAAAPFWAASLALMREYAQRQGVADLGFIAPALYRIAANPATKNAFHQPLRGGNRKYSVTQGWNYVTGLGSPDVAALARDMVALAKHG